MSTKAIISLSAVATLAVVMVALLIVGCTHFWLKSHKIANEIETMKWESHQEYLVREKGYSWITCLGHRVACPPPPKH